MANALSIFVSHRVENSAFCHALVTALRNAGADVWYDERHLGSDLPMNTIQQELERRTIFILLLSRHAFASRQIRRETILAYELADRDPARVLLPVTVGTIEASDFAPGTSWLFLADFKRIEMSDYQPYPQAEAIGHVLHTLSLLSADNAPTPLAPQHPACAHDLIARGKALRDQRKLTEALPFYERATELTRHCFCAWANLGYIFCELGVYEQAISALSRALRLKCNDAATWNNMGRALNNVERYVEGLAASERSLVLDSTSRQAKYAWNNKGWALIGLGRYEEALTALDQSLALDPISQHAVHAWNNKGWVLNDLQRYEEALIAVEQALALDADPRQAVLAWNNKGWALKGLGRYDEALIAYDEALTVDPAYAHAWNGKGATLTDLSRYTEALSLYDQALALDPTLVLAWKNKAIALRGLGRIEEAAEAEAQAKALSK